jgi:RNA-binding protein
MAASIPPFFVNENNHHWSPRRQFKPGRSSRLGRIDGGHSKPDGKESRMAALKGYQRKYLRGLAHALKPVVQVGQKGLADGVLETLAEALETHELVKVKFVEHKEKNRKADFAEIIETKTGAALVGVIGHTAIFYRPKTDPEKRKIALPEK